MDQLHKQVRGTQPAVNEGISLDATSVVSPNFSVGHALKFGTPHPNYTFMSVYQSSDLLLHASIDHQANLNARFHHHWIPHPTPSTLPSVVTKLESQLAEQSIFSVEHEIQTEDYSFSARAINPMLDQGPSYNIKSKASVTGIFSLSYLQQITKKLSLGGEFVYQKSTPEVNESITTLVARYIPTPDILPKPFDLPENSPSPFPPVDPKDPTQVYTATFSPNTGMLHASYWRKVNPRFELGAECQSLLTPSLNTGRPGRREAIAALSFKLQTVFANIKSQIDTHGKIASTIDYVLAPGLQFQIGAEMDYAKGNGGEAKCSMGFSMEA